LKWGDRVTVTSEETTPVELVVTLGSYLSYIKSEELAKAESQRRSVPTIGELAEAAGIHRVTMQNLVSGDVKRVNFETLSAVVNELRRRGFNPRVSDLLILRGVEPPGHGEGRPASSDSRVVQGEQPDGLAHLSASTA
jgi:hypothetical protein